MSKVLDKPKKKKKSGQKKSRSKTRHQAVEFIDNDADPILPQGNLGMNHVEYLFQNLIQNIDQKVGEDVGRKYGATIVIQDGGNNIQLREQIENFLLGQDPVTAHGAVERKALDRKLGQERVLLMLSTQDHLPSIISGNLSKGAKYNHWTVLHLKRGNDGRLIIRYADSIGQHNGKDIIPNSVKNALIQVCKINKVRLTRRNFNSTPQTSLNCGYNAVFHALQMLNLNVIGGNIESFINITRVMLQERFGTIADINPEKPKNKPPAHNPFLPDPRAFLDSKEKPKIKGKKNRESFERLTKSFMAIVRKEEVLHETINQFFKNRDINVQGQHGETLLHWACHKGNIDLVQYLVNNKKAATNIKNSEGRTPLEHANYRYNLKRGKSKYRTKIEKCIKYLESLERIDPKFTTPIKKRNSGVKQGVDQDFQSPVSAITQGIDKLAITPEFYGGKTFFRKTDNKRNKYKGKIKLDTRDKVKSDGTNEAVKYPVIVQSPGKHKMEESRRKSGNDELFQRAKKKLWNDLDTEFKLDEKTDVTFNDAYRYARVKVKELFNFGEGHIGALYDSVSGPHRTSQIAAGYFKGSWDLDKNKVIEKVTQAAKSEEEKKSSPIKATGELLKLAVQKTSRYKDNTRENEEKFRKYKKYGKKLEGDIYILMMD